VIKHVVNNNGGTKTAPDFTMTISGVNAVGGNSFAGSEAGVTKTLSSVGSYSVGESSPPGYALTGTSADCFGTIAPGQHKTCTLTNDDLP
jgi:Prealbumin-like fold domain